jgi:hypothetical protein
VEIKSSDPPAKLKELVEAHRALKNVDAGAAEAVLALGRETWPLADYFRPEA